jgi:hypothetical protein
VRDAVIAAERVRLDPLDAGHQLDDLELLDLVVEPADLRLVQLLASPRLGLVGDDPLDDVDDLPPGLDALLLKLQERFVGGDARFLPPRCRE